MLKLCSTCKFEKSLDAFNNNAGNTDGKCGKCRECQRIYHREYYLRNPQKFLDKRILNKEKIAADNKIYRLKNKERLDKYVHEWHINNRDKHLQYYRNNYQTIEGRSRHLHSAAYRRKPEGFALTLDHVVSCMSKGNCPMTGIAFDLQINSNGIRKRSWSPYAPSLDKIDPRKPYTNENTRVVIWQYNVMKGELSDSQVLDICKAIINRKVA